MLDGLDAGVVNYSIDDFYHFSRMCLIKDERHYDRFDKVFGDYVNGLQSLFEEKETNRSTGWLGRNHGHAA